MLTVCKENFRLWKYFLPMKGNLCWPVDLSASTNTKLLSVQVILWTLDNGNTINSLELDNSNSECYYFERLERVLATQVLALSNPSTGVTGYPSHFEAAASGLGNQTNNWCDFVDTYLWSGSKLRFRLVLIYLVCCQLMAKQRWKALKQKQKFDRQRFKNFTGRYSEDNMFISKVHAEK